MDDLPLHPSYVARCLAVSVATISHHININSKTGDFWRKNPYVRVGIANHLNQGYLETWGEENPLKVFQQIKQQLEDMKDTVFIKT